jgi:hypothetical protein
VVFNPVEGDQVKVGLPDALDAVSVVEEPAQITGAAGLMVKAGAPVNVTGTEVDLLHPLFVVTVSVIV